MKIVCNCGAVTEFITSEDGELYTEDEGWYKIKNGLVDIYGAHDQVFFDARNAVRKSGYLHRRRIGILTLVLGVSSLIISIITTILLITQNK